jgi:hypothetical protein
MTTAHTLQRSLIVGLGALGLAFALTGTASAATSTIPNDVVVVSSTQAGSGSFTMTATNVGDLAVDLDLAAPGVVSNVSVDYGSYDGRWTINDLAPGATSTMMGSLLQPL